jgi:PBP1b-binding outer membrane lipoprotein LpoB
VVAVALAALLGACATPPQYKAQAPIDIDPSIRGPVAGIGIEGHDIVSMTDRMARDLLAQPHVSRRSAAPRIVVDAQHFRNEGAQIINRNTITDRLRVNLNRAAAGRMVFVGRENAAMVEHERELKRIGKVDTGTTGLARAQFGADYRLAGRIAALDSRNPKTGLMQRYTQITLQLVDLETGALVWEDMYEIARAAADDIIYR